jgi:nucleoid-associated protein YgaU
VLLAEGKISTIIGAAGRAREAPAGVLCVTLVTVGGCGRAVASGFARPNSLEAEMPNPKEPDFSSVQSGGSSTAPSAPSSGTPGQTYTVKKGDSLSKIAKRVYGDAQQWRKIHEANRDIIDNPDLIHPGQVLKLPGA